MSVDVDRPTPCASRRLRSSDVAAATSIRAPAVPLAAVPFLAPESGGRPGTTPGSVDYRFARRQLLHRYRAGELTQADVCDAQHELLRVGRNCSQRARHDCPVCGEHELRLARFVFGPRMPAGGRVVASRSELVKLADRATSNGLRCFTVEVCLACRWNHLLDITPVGGRAQD